MFSTREELINYFQQKHPEAYCNSNNLNQENIELVNSNSNLLESQRKNSAKIRNHLNMSQISKQPTAYSNINNNNINYLGSSGGVSRERLDVNMNNQTTFNQNQINNQQSISSNRLYESSRIHDKPKMDRWEYLYNLDKHRTSNLKQRQEEERESKIKQEDELCTFSPKIMSQSKFSAEKVSTGK